MRWRLLDSRWLLAMAITSGCTPDPVSDDLAGIEVIGLRSWNISMLRDSLQRYRPDVQLGDAACGAVLRDSLRFPDASVLRFRDGRVVVTVIEPSDSARVVLRSISGTEPTRRGPWHGLRTLQDSAGIAVASAIVTFPAHAAGESVSVDSTESEVVTAVWSLLAAAEAPSHWRAAVAALRGDPEPAVRRAAASYVVRYAQIDSVWYGLVAALRDPDWGVRGAANDVLRTFRTGAARTLDWRPAAQDIRHLLDGTTLVFHTEVVKLLLATGASQALAADVLSPASTRLLLEQLTARHEYVREPAHQLLVRFAGRDHGLSPEPWREWAESVAQQTL
jgi:hypothetical protein